MSQALTSGGAQTAAAMRQVVQPGTPAVERIQWVEARGRGFSFVLEAGLPLLEAARRGFAAEGFTSGVLTIQGGALGPFAYVMPALAKTADHAAFYSDTFRPAGITRLKTATLTFGERDGAPFFHCHGLWTEADGRVNGGHMLPEETVVAEPVRVEAFGISGAAFVAEQDPETNFKLFGPLSAPPVATAAPARAFALRLRPNQDFARSLEGFCREQRIRRARLRGGVGSIIGARFADGRAVDAFAIEMAVMSGTIASHPGQGPVAELDVFLVDYLGGTAEGRLVRGDNPVLMTMELVLEVLDSAWEGPHCFYAGTKVHPIYVDHVRPSGEARGKTPVVMVHGGGHTGACYLTTPDLRPGWAARFAAAGRDVFVPDWPGHGRSPMGPDFARLSSADVATSLLALLEQVGPAVLLVHSASGPMAWWMAEQRPDKIAAVVAIAPGPPANLLPNLPDDPVEILALRDDASAGHPRYSPEDRPVWFDAEFAAAYWAKAPRFPKHAFEAYYRSIVPESARLLNERFNIGGKGLKVGDPKNLQSHRILVVTGEHDPRHPRAVDAATAAWLGADFVWLPDRGIRGNGHMMMIEDNSDELAAMILAWLDANGC